MVDTRYFTLFEWNHLVDIPGAPIVGPLLRDPLWVTTVWGKRLGGPCSMYPIVTPRVSPAGGNNTLGNRPRVNSLWGLHTGNPTFWTQFRVQTWGNPLFDPSSLTLSGTPLRVPL